MEGVRQKPDWAPPGAGEEFASFVHPGIRMTETSSSQPYKRVRRRELSVDDYVRGIGEGNRAILARAITLIESHAPAHRLSAQELVARVTPQTGRAIRVGITGVPGVGKSTFIEALGMYLCGQGLQVAVLAVDPTSPMTHGSVLGDKTRMEELSRHPKAFIRPSPAGGALGGVTRKSRETILLCEAFGFDVVLVETVGVGQSETTVRSMVDFFLVLALAGAGDELQGIKKGIIELADAILVTKADGDNELRAQTARAEYEKVLHYLTPATEGWRPQAMTVSALTKRGIPEIWQTIREFETFLRTDGRLEGLRHRQNVEWFEAMLEMELRRVFDAHPDVAARLPEIRQQVESGKISPALAAEEMIRHFVKSAH